jgi:hypothetical protein
MTKELPVMNTRWVGILAVLALIFAIAVVKLQYGGRSAEWQPTSADASATPQVLLVASPGEATSSAKCGQIVREVLAAENRGVAVRKLAPDSGSELMTRYHVLTSPTVLILEANGSVRARYEGEAQETLDAVRAEMTRLR